MRMCAIGHVSSHLNIVIRKLAQLAVISAELLLLRGDTKGETRDKVHEEEENASESKGPGEDGKSTSDLVTKLNKVTVNPADGIVLSTIKRSNGFAFES
jgi:hypothetical protein